MTYDEAKAAAARLYDGIRDESRAVAEMRLAVALAETYTNGWRDACEAATFVLDQRIAERLGVLPPTVKH
jgi:hypothetical protein